MADRIILPRALDSNGDIVPGAVAYFFATGTTTPLTVYSDPAGSTSIGTSLASDSAGVFAATFTNSPLKVDIRTPAGVSLPGFPSDNFFIVPTSSSAAGNVTFSPTVDIPETNVQSAIEHVQTDVNTRAPKASPAFTGVPTAPTAGSGTSNTQIATTAYVRGQVLDEDDFATNSAARPPSQQSTKAYVDASIAAAKLIFPAQVATTTGTAFDFEDIPTTVSEIIIVFDGVSLSGTDDVLVQLGTAGGIGASGYDSASLNAGSSGVVSTAGLIVRAIGAGNALTGHMTITRMESNLWTASHTMRNAPAGSTVSIGAGDTQAFALAVNRVRITRTGTDTFDAGAIRIGYR